MPSFRLSEIELSTLPTPSVNGTERLMQRPELIPARLLAALVTPEFHRGEGFSRLFLDSPWPSGRLLTLSATIPAIPQVLHLPISLGIHLHRSVICPDLLRRTGCPREPFGLHFRSHSDTASPYTSLPKERIGPIFVWRTCKERVHAANRSCCSG